jgi:tetratricopeptide (TPR) repeat protein
VHALIVLSASLAAALLAALPVQAQSASNRERCWNRGNSFPPDATIAACTRIIESGNESHRNLSRAYYQRGSAWLARRRYDRAIDDFSEVIGLNPYLGAEPSRGWYLKRHFRDYGDTTVLDPNLAPAYYGRGLARQAKGDKVGGDADIAMARKLKPGIGQ